MLTICKLGEDVLRKKSLPVEKIDDEIKKLADDMIETMIAADGVGLAAVQVGILLRMFVAMADDGVKRVFINPQILATSEELTPYEEGCLSVPETYEAIIRPKEVKVQALDENGKPFILEADGLLARIIQHEIDHLEGVLFIDKGDEEFARKTAERFERRAARAALKKAEKEAKAKRIAAKIAAKNARKNKAGV